MFYTLRARAETDSKSTFSRRRASSLLLRHYSHLHMVSCPLTSPPRLAFAPTPSQLSRHTHLTTCSMTFCCSRCRDYLWSNVMGSRKFVLGSTTSRLHGRCLGTNSLLNFLCLESFCRLGNCLWWVGGPPRKPGLHRIFNQSPE